MTQINQHFIGDVDLRKQEFDTVVKGIAERTYKLKQLVKVNSTSAWRNYFYREKADVLSPEANGGAPIRGIPRGAGLPQADVAWDKLSIIIQKYGLSQNIPWEDTLMDDLDVENRTALKLGEAVAKSVDDAIWDGWGGNNNLGGATAIGTGATANSSINSFSVVGNGWDESSGAIIDNLMRAKQILDQQYYPTSELVAVMSPRDHRSVVKWITDKGSQFPALSNSTALNGEVPGLAGFRFVVSNSVSNSNVMVLVPQRNSTWKSAVDLSTAKEEVKFQHINYKVVELGALQDTDPLARVLIMGTQSNFA